MRITVARVDGERHHVIEVGGTTPAAGRWDLGPGLRVAILGDWDADGVDTPAVVTADGVAWHFEEWSDATAVRLGTAPVTGRVAVATDPTGRDHLVSMDAAATLPKPPGD